MDWRHNAVCREEDPELFFPIGNTGPALLQIEEAKAVCRRCPVMEQCLQWALETGQDSRRVGWPQRGRASRDEAPRRPQPRPQRQRLTRPLTPEPQRAAPPNTRSTQF